jgi:hypothetical protein
MAIYHLSVKPIIAVADHAGGSGRSNAVLTQHPCELVRSPTPRGTQKSKAPG